MKSWKTSSQIAAVVLAFAAMQAHALEARPVKTATDKAGNIIIEQYDVQAKAFKGDKGGDTETVALIVMALCHSPRDYKETNGPFVSEPVKHLLSQVKDDGSVTPAEAGPWVAAALEATNNEKHKAVLEKVRAKYPAAKAEGFSKADDLNPAASKEWLVAALPKAEALVHAKTKEITVDGKAVKWGEELAGKLIALQQKNGSFGTDLQVNALALRVLTLCYKSMK